MATDAISMENRGPTVLTVTIIMLTLSTVFVILRLVSRIGVVKKISADDYAIILAWFIAFGFSFSICYGTAVGLGRHETTIPSEQQNTLKRAEYAFSVLYNPALMATKTSICLFYLTLAKNQVIFKWTTIGTLVVVNVAGLALTLLNIFQCRPVGAAFDESKPEDARCIDIVALYLSSAPVNIVTDLALLFLPMPILTSMRLPRNEKIILIVTFSFGAFVAVVDVVRIAYLESAALARLQNMTQSSGLDTEGDYAWIASLSFMWSAVEVHIGMICACVPGVKPLAARVFPALLGRIKAASDMHGSSASGAGNSDQDAARKSQSNYSGFRSNRQSHASMSPTLVTSPRSPTFPRSSHDSENHFGTREDQDMGMMDFLTMPDIAVSTLQQRQTQATFGTSSTSRPRTPSITIFDFVHIKHPRSMVKMRNMESIPHLALVTVLFFLWGAAYGLLDVLNQRFQLIVGISSAQAIGLHSAYYGAYLVGPLTIGQYVLRKWGFKATFIVGLCVYGIGTLIFWPSAVLASFPAFLISNLIIGLGVSILETGGNLFVTLCGPSEYAEIRLNISQGVQAIGTVLSPLLAQKVLFKTVLDAPSLIDVQWTYLGIALFDVALALVFYYMPLPEAPDEDLQALADRKSSANRCLPFPKSLPSISITTLTLVLGILSQFWYVGSQEAVAYSFQKYIFAVVPQPAESPFNFLAIAHTAFALGRFLTALTGVFLKPRHALCLLFLGVIITSALAMSLSGYGGIAMLVLILFFESGIFSLIFAIALRGLGKHTKWGAAYMTASISGGAFVPGIMYLVQQSKGVRYSYCVALAVFVFGAIFPVYLEVFPAARKQVDPLPSQHPSTILGRPEKEKTNTEATSKVRTRKSLISSARSRRYRSEGVVAK